MKTLFILFSITLIALLCILVPMYSKYKIAKEQVTKAVNYTNLSDDTSVAVLILGDSTAVGVGTDSPEDTVGALLSGDIGATHVENYAKSGAVVADLPEQIAQASLSSYTHILIQIGGNDIIRFHDVAQVRTDLQAALEQLPDATQVTVLSAGNVGGTTFFPFFIRPYYTNKTLQYHAAFTEVVEKSGGTYVNLYEDPAEDVFVQQPDIYLSPDGLHPSSAGYMVWYQKVKNKLNL